MPGILIETPEDYNLSQRKSEEQNGCRIRYCSFSDSLSNLDKRVKEDTVISIVEDPTKRRLEFLKERSFLNCGKSFILLVDTEHYPQAEWLNENLLLWPYAIDKKNINKEVLISIASVFNLLFSQMRFSTVEFQTQLKELNEIGIALSSEKNLESLLNKILKEVRKFTNADAGSLYIKDKNNLVFKVAHNDSIDTEDENGNGFKEFSIPISSKSIAGYVAITGEPINIEDVYNIPDSEPFKHDPGFDRKFGYRTKSVLASPMKDNQGELIGVLQIINALDENKNPIPFSGKITSLVESLGSQAAVAIKNAKLIDDINTLLMSILEYSTSLIDARSRHTAGHSHRVAHLVLEIARAINLESKGAYKDTFFNEDQMQEMYFAALLHDIGKIGIPESILDKHHRVSDEGIEALKWRIKYARLLLQQSDDNLKIQSSNESDDDEDPEKILQKLDNLWKAILKINETNFLDEESKKIINEFSELEFHYSGETFNLLTEKEYQNLTIVKGNLTVEEREIIKSHIHLSNDTLEKIPFPPHLADVPKIASMHHEMLDGSGYPKGLKENSIPLQSRILAVSDFIDALSARDRPYRLGMDVEKTIEILLKEADNGKYDKILAEFIKEGLESERIMFPWYIVSNEESE